MDKGFEYKKQEFENYSLSTGLRHEIASTNNTHRVGVSEHNSSILEAMTRRLLKDIGLPPFFWGELMFAVACLLSRVPHSVLCIMAPFKKLCGKDVKLSHLRITSARSFVHAYK